MGPPVPDSLHFAAKKRAGRWRRANGSANEEKERSAEKEEKRGGRKVERAEEDESWADNGSYLLT